MVWVVLAVESDEEPYTQALDKVWSTDDDEGEDETQYVKQKEDEEGT